MFGIFLLALTLKVDRLLSHNLVLGTVDQLKSGLAKRAHLANTISENYAIDLIVLGATGRGAIQRTLIGSTTDYVVNHALCNALVVR